MYYEYHQKTSSSITRARGKYGLYYPHYSDESLLARYYLLEYLFSLFGEVFLLGKDQYGKPKPIERKAWENIFWSISHSEHHIAFIVSDRSCGIDIVEYEERDDALLALHRDDEYTLLGGRNWYNFYLLWTAKESIIKSYGWIIDDMKDIKTLKIDEDSVSTFGFHEKIYKIKTERVWTTILSYTYP